MVEELREQVIREQELALLEGDERSPLARFFQSLKPMQRLMLAVLLALDVAILGCMLLVMLGRVGSPF